MEYLSRYCSQTAGLRTALLSDMQCGDILQDLCILGLLGKFLTGPWIVGLTSCSIEKVKTCR